MSKKDFNIKELIQNQSFRRVVHGTADPKEIKWWDSWIENNEQNREKAKKAISEIAGFEFNDPVHPEVEKEWDRLYNSTVGKKNPVRPPVLNRKTSFSWLYRVAAILIIGTLIGMGAYIYWGSDQASSQLKQITQERTIKTGSNEQKTVRFSNGSKVVLNNNSTLIYTLGLLHNETIEVILEGEAYFDAENSADQNQSVFAVRTPDGVIRDIGTEFLVSVQKDRSRVVLQEGKVEVHTKEQDSTSDNINITKGEMLEFDKTKILKKQTVNSTFYTSWATGSMEFDQTTIKTFAGFVEQRFNVNVRVVDPRLTDIKLDGGIYFKSLEELVRSVSEVAKIPVYQSEDRKTVYIGDKVNNR